LESWAASQQAIFLRNHNTTRQLNSFRLLPETGSRNHARQRQGRAGFDFTSEISALSIEPSVVTSLQKWIGDGRNRPFQMLANGRGGGLRKKPRGPTCAALVKNVIKSNKGLASNYFGFSPSG
jgi:hypothetical protein